MPAEERKLATVLFADLVGSTALASDQDPERVRAMLDRFYDLMSAEIERAGGTIEKFVGDAVMAAFGAPSAHEDDAERALHVALAMQRRLSQLFGGSLGLRVGVNTGDVVVGRPREGSSFVTGDAVNVCARLEQAAKPGEILVGERTVAAARGAFEFSTPITIEAKGKAGGVTCQRLVRALSLMRPRGVRGQDPAFVGRDEELHELRRHYESVVAHREPRLVGLVGDAGVGKTRLMREIWQGLAAESPRPLLRIGRCLSYGQGITYWPLGEVLKEHFAILDSDSPDTIAARLGDRPGLGYTVGLAPPVGVHPLTVRDQLQQAWISFLQELVTERPVVLLIEDLHWAEPDLYDLLDSLVERVDGPLLVLITARPELFDLRPAWQGRVVQLNAFAPGGTTELIEAILGPDCPASIAELILTKAEGNAFFVEELISTLIDRKVVVRSDDGWSFQPLPAGFAVPDTIHAVLAARIDLLPAAQKAALQAAAVMGRAFWVSPLVELTAEAAPDLDMLEQREFIHRRAGSSMFGEQEYAIKHALTREVAYDSLLKAKRAQLHARFADWLGRHGDADEHAPLLAHHYAEAVRPDDLDLAWFGREDEADRLRRLALAWLSRAAELAIGRYEMDEGLALLHHAIELEAEPPALAELWQKVGHTNALKFDGDAFWKAIDAAITIGGPRADLYAELAFQSWRRWGMWRQQPDMTLIEGWIDRALELAEAGSRDQALALFARSGLAADDDAARTLTAIAEERGELDLIALARTATADIAQERDDSTTVHRLLAELFELVPQLNDPDDQTRSLLDVVMGNVWLGDLAAARQATTMNVELSQGLTPHHRLHGRGGQSLIAVLSGEWDEVTAMSPQYERAVDDNADTPCPQNATTLLHCALARTYLSDDMEARRLEEKAEAIGLTGWRFWLDPPRIRLALARGDLNSLPALLDSYMQEANRIEAPSAYFDALVALNDRQQIEAEAPRWILAGSFAQPFALRALGWARRNQSMLGQALAQFEAMRLPWQADQTRRLLAQ